MPAIVRLSKKGLTELIETTEAAGCDTTCLRGLLAEVEEEERRRKPPRREVPPPRILVEEPTTEEREEYLEEKRAQSQVEHGTDLECMVCHQKFDHLISGTCEVCWREWMLGTKPKG